MIVARNGVLFGIQVVALAATSVAFSGIVPALAAPGIKPSAAEQLKADEQEMLARARREADEAKRASRILDGTVTMKPDETATGRTTVNVGQSPAEQKALEAKRVEELQRLSDKLRRASMMRQMRPQQPAVETPWSTEVTQAPARENIAPNQRSALGVHAAVDTNETRATVLMVMTAGNKGIRRFDKTADPILCTTNGCYISNGPATPAQFLSISRTFGISNTFGPRAGACKQQLSCVFRSIDLSDRSSYVQPVDMRVMHHDRREAKQLAVDHTCRTEGDRLTCGRPIQSSNYTLWVVPESVAQKAGIDMLNRALYDGLQSTKAADLTGARQLQ